MPLEEDVSGDENNLPKELSEAFKSYGCSTDEQKKEYVMKLLAAAGWPAEKNMDFQAALHKYVLIQKSFSRENRDYPHSIKPKKHLQ